MDKSSSSQFFVQEIIRPDTDYIKSTNITQNIKK